MLLTCVNNVNYVNNFNNNNELIKIYITATNE